jgi:tetratricopeptide (TPR) repeat protein
MNYKSLITILSLSAALTACDLDSSPYDAITRDQLPTTPNALLMSTDGVYALMKPNLPYKGRNDHRSTYVRNLHHVLEYPSDNVTLSATTSDPLYYAAVRIHAPAMENTTYLWNTAYRMINAANQNIEAVDHANPGANAHLLGENYFLRAMATFDLARIFAKPYSHGTENLGVLLKKTSSDPDHMERATVGETYKFIVSDLRRAATFMEAGTSRGVEYASKAAAWGLLSRAYLYMQNYDSAIYFADRVIQDTDHSLVDKTKYADMFHNTYQHPEESIFVIKHLLQDNRGSGSIGSMYLTDEGLGWGEVYATTGIRALLGANPEDVRNTLIKPHLAQDGVTVEQRNGIDKYFITKFSYQDGIVTLSSPHVIRLGEVYLNRAEAYAHKGENQKALDDVNTIRARAGLAVEKQYTTSDLLGKASVLEAVLDERRMELAFEGHRCTDLYRNKLNMDRNFPGVQEQVIVSWNDDRNIFYIPQDEMLANKLISQND